LHIFPGVKTPGYYHPSLRDFTNPLLVSFRRIQPEQAMAEIHVGWSGVGRYCSGVPTGRFENSSQFQLRVSKSIRPESRRDG